MGGLSPPTRGSPLGTRTNHYRRGSIPAHAGEPAITSSMLPFLRVYPRPRGGASDPWPKAVPSSGLSPPTRGSLRDGGVHRGVPGSIPAHAGEPVGIRDERFLPGVYPRPRGGAIASWREAHASQGLSPPTRGSRDALGNGRANVRSIPAHAGEPVTRGSRSGCSRVYPRPRGGAIFVEGDVKRAKGLSPPTRGSHCPHAFLLESGGSIPAHAGEPRTTGPPGARSRVYPRPRGGACLATVSGDGTEGLSPPTRGSRSALPASVRPRGSIPAHAGEPPAGTKMASPRKVYPRPRGGADICRSGPHALHGLSPPTRGSLIGPVLD